MEKAEAVQMETRDEHEVKRSMTELADNEDEPQSPYQLGWRTILCVVTLSLANCCAALANTVSLHINQELQEHS